MRLKNNNNNNTLVLRGSFNRVLLKFIFYGHEVSIYWTGALSNKGSRYGGLV